MKRIRRQSSRGDVLKPAENPPPVLGSWTRLYALVLGALALWIILLALFARVFR